MEKKHWTKRELERLHVMRSEGRTYREIAAAIGRTVTSCRNQHYNDKKRFAVGRVPVNYCAEAAAIIRREAAYAKGHKSRMEGGAKVSPHSSGPEHWSWLAGWHDADMELGVSYIGAAMASQ